MKKNVFRWSRKRVFEEVFKGGVFTFLADHSFRHRHAPVFLRYLQPARTCTSLPALAPAPKSSGPVFPCLLRPLETRTSFPALAPAAKTSCQLNARLEHAKLLLMTTDFPDTDISLDAGFTIRGTFSYVFANRIGMLPTVYRNKMRSIIRVPGETPSGLISGCFSLMCGHAH